MARFPRKLKILKLLQTNRKTPANIPKVDSCKFFLAVHDCYLRLPRHAVGLFHACEFHCIAEVERSHCEFTKEGMDPKSYLCMLLVIFDKRAKVYMIVEYGVLTPRDMKTIHPGHVSGDIIFFNLEHFPL